jgi:hypothetical protein
MRNESSKFLAILRVELEDLMLDLKDAEEMYRGRFTRGDVSGYVLKENTAVLENELAGIRSVIHELWTIDTSRYETLDDLCKELHLVSLEAVKRLGFPAALLGMMSRKCAKVRRYLAEAG